MADDPWSVFRRFAAADPPPGFPPGALTISAAIISTASPHVSRPFRLFGRKGGPVRFRESEILETLEAWRFGGVDPVRTAVHSAWYAG